MIETKTSPPTTCFFPTKDLMPRNWHEIIAQLKFKTRDFGGFPWVFRFSVQCSMVFPWFSPKKKPLLLYVIVIPWVFPMGFPPFRQFPGPGTWAFRRAWAMSLRGAPGSSRGLPLRAHPFRWPSGGAPGYPKSPWVYTMWGPQTIAELVEHNSNNYGLWYL